MAMFGGVPSESRWQMTVLFWSPTTDQVRSGGSPISVSKFSKHRFCSPQEAAGTASVPNAVAERNPPESRLPTWAFWDFRHGFARSEFFPSAARTLRLRLCTLELAP